MSLVSSVKRKSGSLMKNVTMCTVCTQRIACLAGSTKCTTTSTTSKQCMKSLTKNMVLALVRALVHCMVASVHCALHCWQVQWGHCASCVSASCIGTLSRTLPHWGIGHGALHCCKWGWHDEQGEHHREHYREDCEHAEHDESGEHQCMVLLARDPSRGVECALLWRTTLS